MHTQGISLAVMVLALVIRCELLQAASGIHPQESMRFQGGEKWKMVQESVPSAAEERTNISFVVKPSAVLQEMFNPRRYNNDSLNRWQGSDVDLSIRLTKDYDLFLYGDSLIGTWNETTGARECTSVFNHDRKPEPCRIGVVSKMPHSTFGVWDRVNRTMTWFWGHNYTSLLQPNWAEPKRIFWGISMTPVYEDGDQFCVIGEQILFVADQPMGFEANGTFAVCLSGVKANPADPRTWSQRWSRVEGSGNEISTPTKKGKSSYPHLGSKPAEAVRIQEDQSRGSQQTTTTSIGDAWTGGGGASTRKLSSRESNVTLGSLNWRNAIYATGNQAHDYLYIYGALSLHGQFSGQVLARLRFTDLLVFNWTALQMYDPRTKGYTLNVVNDFVPMAPQEHLELLPILKLWWLTIPEFTVQYSNVLSAFFLLYIDFDEYQVKIKTSPRLEGPWTQEGLAIYNLPWPMNASKDVFCYATKVHPDLYDYVAPNPHSASSEESSSPSPDTIFGRQPQGQGVGPETIVSEVFPFSYVCNGKEVRALYEAEFADVYLPVFNTLEVSKQI